MVPGLKSMVARIAPAEAVRVLAAALKQGSNPSGLADLMRILSATLDRLDAAEAHRVCDPLVQSLDRDLFDSVAAVSLSQLDPRRAHALAWDLASNMCSRRGIETVTLSQILTDTSREQRARRAALMARAGPGPEGVLEATMRISAEPFPCRLTTQELVELLKMPTCYGQSAAGSSSTTWATATNATSSTTGRSSGLRRNKNSASTSRPRPSDPTTRGHLNGRARRSERE